MYELIFDKDAIKFLNKLEKSIAERIFKKIQQTKKDPHKYFVRLTDKSEYKLRVGDYRVIADIDDKKIVIYVILIGHRKNIYKKL